MLGHPNLQARRILTLLKRKEEQCLAWETEGQFLVNELILPIKGPRELGWVFWAAWTRMVWWSYCLIPHQSGTSYPSESYGSDFQTDGYRSSGCLRHPCFKSEGDTIVWRVHTALRYRGVWYESLMKSWASHYARGRGVARTAVIVEALHYSAYQATCFHSSEIYYRLRTEAPEIITIWIPALYLRFEYVQKAIVSWCESLSRHLAQLNVSLRDPETEC